MGKDLFENIACNVCGGSETASICEKGQFGLTCHLVVCKNCGLGYLNPRWTEERYLDYYKFEYDKHYRPGLPVKDKGDWNSNAIIQRIKQFLPSRKTKIKVLDIGSGEGNNLIDFKDYFLEADLLAIEPSEKAQIKLAEMGVELVSNDVNSSFHKEYKGSIDVVIMRHVLEHMLDPKEVLRKVHQVMHQNTVLYIAVPNNLKPNRSMTNWWVRVVHTFYFNAISLGNLTQICGFEPLLMVEGDERNPGELFACFKKSSEPINAKFDTAISAEQISVFKRALAKDKSPWNRIKNFWKYRINQR